MHWQTVHLILVFWVAVLFFTRVVSNDGKSDSPKSKLANKLNMLVQHSGWRLMGNVKIKINKNRKKEIADPLSDILEALSSDRKPIDESNVDEKYKEIFTVLKCKYAEVLIKCKILIQQLIRVCRNEKRMLENWFEKYYNCFNSVLNKLLNMSAMFKSMTDALDLIYSLDGQWKLKSGVMVATEKLAKFTMTVGQRAESEFSKHGINENGVEFEMQTISDYILDLFNKNVNGFVTRNCNIPNYKDLTATILRDDFEYKKSQQVIPEETTLLQYVEEDVDRFVDDIFVSCFYSLGFLYDEEFNVTIRTN